MIDRRLQVAAGIPLAVAVFSLVAGCAERPRPVAPLSAYGYRGELILAERDAAGLEAARSAIQGVAGRILFSLDANNPKSDLYRLNHIAGNARWPIPNDTFRALDLLHHYARETGGALDLTLAPVAELWGLPNGQPPEEPPPSDVLVAALNSVGEHKIKLSDDGTIAFYSPVIRVELGALAAGYALDMGVVQARRQGFTNLFARLHQSARALGIERPGHPWTLDIPDPWQTNLMAGRLSLPPGSAVAIARLYEKSVVIGGKTYGHILNPRTGAPATETAMAVVIGPSATLAGALAQALISTDIPEAEKMLARFTRCEVLMVPERKPSEWWMTAKFAERFTSVSADAQNRRILERAAEPPPLPPDPELLENALDGA